LEHVDAVIGALEAESVKLPGMPDELLPILAY
jgi:hypothetical protein